MSRTSNQAGGDVVRDFLLVADLLEEPQLAQLYAYLAHEGEATVQNMMDDLELAQGTAYSYVNRLVDAGVIEVTHDEQPQRYAACEIDLTVTTAAGDREYTITPALIDAVGRRETDADIDTYIDRHGVAGLATALTYAVAGAGRGDPPADGRGPRHLAAGRRDHPPGAPIRRSRALRYRSVGSITRRVGY